MFKYYSVENRPAQNYGPFYNVLGTHQAVEDYMFSFHALGCGDLKYLETKTDVAYEYRTLLDIYSFWREKGFISQKQIRFTCSLLQKIGELR